jgi:hypothetical protein
MTIRPGHSHWVRKSMWRIFGSTKAGQPPAPPVVPKRDGGAVHHVGNSLDEKIGHMDVEQHGDTDRANAQFQGKEDVVSRKPSFVPPAVAFSIPRSGPSYSIFPPTDSVLQVGRSGLSVNDSVGDVLLPPRPTFLRHRRFSSEVSAATVQIGLQLSDVVMPVAFYQGPSSSTLSLPLVSPVQQAGISQISLTSTGAPTSTTSRGPSIELRSPSECHQTEGINLEKSSARSLWQRRSDAFGRFRRWSPLYKKHTAGACVNKDLPPTPLRVSTQNRMTPQRSSVPSPTGAALGKHLQQRDSIPKPGKACRQAGGWI